MRKHPLVLLLAGLALASTAVTADSGGRRAQVQAMAKKYYAPQDQSIIVVGDSKAIAEQLKPYGTFETREK